MRLSPRVGPWSTIRSYATRRPERPPPKPKDPLSAPNATYYQIGPNLTFIHRPPPTAPTPFSLSTAPASPLLLSPSAPSTTSSQISEEAASTSTSPLTLPPPIRKEKKQQPEKKLTPEEIEEIRRLRAEDPATWSSSKLATRFGCSPCYVSMIAPLKKPVHREILARRDEVHEAYRSRWGERKATVVAIRKKRKSFW